MHQPCLTNWPQTRFWSSVWLLDQSIAWAVAWAVAQAIVQATEQLIDRSSDQTDCLEWLIVVFFLSFIFLFVCRFDLVGSTSLVQHLVACCLMLVARCLSLVARCLLLFARRLSPVARCCAASASQRSLRTYVLIYYFILYITSSWITKTNAWN